MDDLKSLKDLVDIKFAQNEEKIAFIEKSPDKPGFEEIKYSYIKETILKLGTGMYRDENIKGKNIAIIGENSSRWFIAYMAAVCGGVAVVPIDKELKCLEIVNILKKVKAGVVVYSNKKKDVVDEVRNILKEKIEYIKMFESDSADRSLDDLIAMGNDYITKGDLEYINLKINKDTLASIVFTSGTSENSKGVMLSHKNLIECAKSVCLGYKELAGKKFLSFLPINHTYEFSITYLSVLLTGGTVGICRGLKYLTEDLKIIKPEAICAVPLLIENIKRKLERLIIKEGKDKALDGMAKATSLLGSVKIDLRRKMLSKLHDNFGGNLKYILCGGAPLREDTAKYMEMLGFVVIEGYGLTESTSMVCGNSIKNRKPGTVGTSNPNVEIRVDLKDGDGNIGEIIVKSDSVMLGYYNNEEETKKVLRKGWLYTGDLGKFDEKGNLIITGRTKNVIISKSGKNIYPEELEAKINEIPLIDESMVYGYADSKGNLIVTARVTLDNEYMEDKYNSDLPSDEEVYDMIWQYIKNINHTLPLYKCIKRLEIKKDKFIKTTIHKIKRNDELKENYKK